MMPNGALTDQHGWYDPAIVKLWLKGQRLPEKAASAVWKQLMNRVITQAYFLTTNSPGIATFVSKNVSGVKRPDTGAFQLVDWSPTK
jgi:hypothetical protein